MQYRYFFLFNIEWIVRGDSNNSIKVFLNTLSWTLNLNIYILNVTLL